MRCGQCDEVFDANAHLQGDGQAPLPLIPAPEVPAQVAQPDPAQKNTEWQGTGPLEESGVDTEPQMPVDPGPQLEQELAEQLEWPETPSATGYEALMDVRPGAVFQTEPAFHLELPDDEPVLQTPEADWAAFAEATEATEASEPLWEDVSPRVPAIPFVDVEPTEIDVPAAEVLTASAPVPLSANGPTFMRTVHKDSRWNRPWVRHSLAGLLAVLVLGLGLQAAHHERDRLAASVPDLRSALAASCEILDCQIAPFKQIDSVVIDASAFVKVRGDVYRLNLTLKNTASMDVAAPAIELTLTDTQDQPMIRYVLSALELGVQQGILVAGSEIAIALPLNVKSVGGVERISGYRLLAFYP